MELKTNFALKHFNTFAIDVKSRFYVDPKCTDELLQIVTNPELKNLKKLILGGGSNILFTSDFDGIVIHPDIRGKFIIEKEGDEVIVKAGAGENWDEFVEWTVDQSFGGLENLSLIPGTVGACPVQNIGAYGAEAGDFIEKVELMEICSGEIKEFSPQQCRFGYRTSIFKELGRNQYIITAVYFRLSLKPEFRVHYGQVGEELKKLGEVNLATVRQAIINIRQSKLPDHKLIPNAGSFFKNPLVSWEHTEILKKRFPDLVHYHADGENYKVAAGWLIDHLGWKGKTHKGAGVHKDQALVLVNHSNASGAEILELALMIKHSVYQEFGIELEFEVNIF